MDKCISETIRNSPFTVDGTQAKGSEPHLVLSVPGSGVLRLGDWLGRSPAPAEPGDPQGPSEECRRLSVFNSPSVCLLLCSEQICGVWITFTFSQRGNGELCGVRRAGPSSKGREPQRPSEALRPPQLTKAEVSRLRASGSRQASVCFSLSSDVQGQLRLPKGRRL